MAVAITQTANPAGIASTGGVTAYNNNSIGAAALDRVVIICIGKEIASVVVSSLTIDDESGSGARTPDLIGSITFGNVGAYMYRATVAPTATQVDVSITWSGAVTAVQNHMTIYVVTDGAAPPAQSGTNTSTDMDATAPLTSGSRTLPTGGGMLAIAACANDAVAKTWANITENLDVASGASGFRWTTAFSTTPGTSARTCTGVTNGEDGAMVWAIFNQSSDPLMLIAPRA